MRKLWLPIVLLLAVAGTANAEDPQPYNVGDKVTINSTGATGTVIAVGGQLPDGGYHVKGHLDSLGPGFPNVGAWYDTAMSGVTVTQPAAPPAATTP